MLELRRDGRLNAIVPLCRRGRIFGFLGDPELTDYLGPVCAEEDYDAIASALVGWLRSGGLSWDMLEGRNLQLPFGERLQAAARGSFRASLGPDDASARVRLPADWDSYLAGLSVRERHELRRKRRRVRREHPDIHVRSASPVTLERDLDTFVELHREAADTSKRAFMQPHIESFFRRIARTLMPLGRLRLDFLELPDGVLAATFGFEFDDCYYLYNSAYKLEAARLSPGIVLVSELMKSAIERGLGTFDLLRGTERYKLKLGACPVPLARVLIRRS